ncbi:podocalyxin [Tachysurus fulvidraco]|uniref:podocalyxin n=1 Tax=Tachysurus fulvidraco TaxID=1234273 RepID=UPI001FEF36EB|nr:podocalyxin [Tachysurus fulvidraco]XP_047659891.1 podocalyxin [Tachysurus fulvidraco]
MCTKMRILWTFLMLGSFLQGAYAGENETTNKASTQVPITSAGTTIVTSTNKVNPDATTIAPTAENIATTGVQSTPQSKDQSIPQTGATKTTAVGSDQTTISGISVMTTPEKTTTLEITTAANAVITSPVETDVTTTPVTTPVTTTPVTTPVTTSNIITPVTTSNIITPVTTSNIITPVTTSNIITPVTTSNIITPVATTTVPRTPEKNPLTATKITTPNTTPITTTKITPDTTPITTTNITTPDTSPITTTKIKTPDTSPITTTNITSTPPEKNNIPVATRADKQETFNKTVAANRNGDYFEQTCANLTEAINVIGNCSMVGKKTNGDIKYNRITLNVETTVKATEETKVDTKVTVKTTEETKVDTKVTAKTTEETNLDRKVTVKTTVKTTVEMTVETTDRPNSRTLIAILTSCGALALFLTAFAIYCCCHHSSYRKNQQHLTEELQTVENGYHDNPTLEVMEVQPEMQEKKMALNGDFNDSWIVPFDNFSKDDIPEEEDTHL